MKKKSLLVLPIALVVALVVIAVETVALCKLKQTVDEGQVASQSTEDAGENREASDAEGESATSDAEDAESSTAPDTSDESTDTAPEKHVLNTDLSELTGIDHTDTVYYPINDYYNATSNDHLTILSNFATYQQTTSYTCGPSCAYMVLNYLDPELAKSYDEMSITEYCGSTGGGVGTSAEQLANFFEQELGWTTEYYMSHTKCYPTCADFLEMVVEWNLKQGLPVIVDWNISSGHWEVIIGYDTMGTDEIDDDVLIFADPSDSHDHYQDGYMCFSASRFFSMWKESTPFDGVEVYRQQYVVATPSK